MMTLTRDRYEISSIWLFTFANDKFQIVYSRHLLCLFAIAVAFFGDLLARSAKTPTWYWIIFISVFDFQPARLKLNCALNEKLLKLKSIFFSYFDQVFFSFLNQLSRFLVFES